MFLRCTLPSATLALAALAAVACPSPAAAAQSRAPVYREIKDWVVACDNTARCEAAGTGEDYPQLILRLVSEAGPDGAPTLLLEAETAIDPATLRLDGRPFAAAALLQPAAAGDDGRQPIGRDAAQVHAFLDAIRNGERLSAGDGDGAPAASLAGLSAALLLIDETQGRLGTVTALLRRGPLPASRVPAAAPAPVLPRAHAGAPPLTDAQRRRLVQTVRATAELQREDCSVEAGSAYDEAEPLNADEALVLVECWRGAYQSTSLAFRLRRDGSGTPQRVRLALPFAVDGETRVVEEFTGASYGKGELSHFAKGRGLADCGESAGWVFDGRDFHLRHYHRLGQCRGGSPGEWPALWRSRGD